MSRAGSTLSFDNSFIASSFSFTLTAFDDALADSPEAIDIQLTNAAITNGTATVAGGASDNLATTITDIDQAIDITLSADTTTIDEEGVTDDAGATGSIFASAIDTIETTDTITSVVLTLANVEAGDTLSFGITDVDLNTNAATGPDAAGFTYTVSSAGATPVLTITHTGATDDAVNTMLNSAVFDNTTNDEPSNTARTVTLTSVTDTGSGTTLDGTVATVNVTPADDAIDLTVTGNTESFTEDAGATGSIFASAIDTIETTDTITSVVLTLANVEAGDTLSFGITDVDLNTNAATGPDAAGFTYTVSSAGATPVLTITHTGATDGAVNTMLNSAVFDNTTNDEPSNTARTVTLTSVTDSGSGTTADGTIATVNVTPVNDAPVNTVPGAQNTTLLVNHTIAGISVVDVDISSSDMQITLSTDIGTLSLSQTTGLTFTTGDGTEDSSLVFTGTLSNVNAALNNLVFHATQAGTATITLLSDDQGATGSGGALTDTDIISVTVSGVVELSAIEQSGNAGGFVINGVAGGDRSGYSVSAAGDVNGDGFADVIVGAPLDSPNSSSSGASFVVFGKSDGTAVELSAIEQSGNAGGFVINGVSGNDQSGISVSSAGDVNGDGLADVIVGATGDDPNGSSSGASYVVFGKSDGTAVELSAIKLYKTICYRIYSIMPNI